MPITFKTHEERMQHPQAKLIPESMWDNFSLFSRSLNEAILELMKVSNEKLSTLLTNLLAKLNGRGLKESAWLAIALSHPDLELSRLRMIANQLNYNDHEL